MAEAPVQRILSDTKLLAQPAWTQDRNSGGLAVNRPALPYQPHVEIEDAWRVCKCRNYSALDGNPMLVNLVIKGFTQRDHVSFALVIMILFAGIEPELHVIEKVEAMPVNEASARRMIFGAEEDGRREDALESFYDSAIVEAVELQPEE